ncbi:hypothetical protein HYPSUDRAFT_68757 [Hypholoma sublateritium FD-334 SS-4]|uniref:MARVEL domain-containing protein n=1 Tax=Hypholoma sublateritium (strain FD-334 SS-4) TaxID=945553 RepID=A0A0D2NN00_HYPSF|nr:hypothetical protein HYPSUDRAFT_68757 [Hypholoma sublateritium FD-334 SS-4]
MAFFYTYRMITLGLSFILSVPLLGLLAHWTSANPFRKTVLWFDSLGLILVSFTLITIPIMLALPEIRKSAYILYTVYELIIVCSLWILWVVAAALAIQQKDVVFPMDDCTVYSDNLISWCDELSAVVGLAVTVFVLLLMYTLLLVVYATVMTSRTGSRVWFKGVKNIQIRIPLAISNLNLA